MLTYVFTWVDLFLMHICLLLLSEIINYRDQTQRDKFNEFINFFQFSILIVGLVDLCKKFGHSSCKKKVKKKDNKHGYYAVYNWLRKRVTQVYFSIYGIFFFFCCELKKSTLKGHRVIYCFW